MKRLMTIVILVISLLVVIGCSSLIPSERQQEETSPNDLIDDITETDIRIDSGRFSVRADNNFIEIKISGVPEEMSYRTFMLSEELKKDFDSFNFQIDEVVNFKYTVNEHDQGVIFDISRIWQYPWKNWFCLL